METTITEQIKEVEIEDYKKEKLIAIFSFALMCAILFKLISLGWACFLLILTILYILFI
jgi:hypothetical protein